MDSFYGLLDSVILRHRILFCGAILKVVFMSIALPQQQICKAGYGMHVGKFLLQCQGK
nr:unnamed protein product [Callosobruchus chinensis]